jgi:arginine N-succinyltransferase
MPRSSKRSAAPIPFVVREARAADLAAVLRLSRLLDSINLPTEAGELRRFLDRSRASFRGRLPRREAVYLFVAEERPRARVVGTSLIVAKHGTPEFPHFYLQMDSDERYSRTLKKMFRHTYLTLRRSLDGPTEVGGLVVDPPYRRHPAQVGKQLSFARFLYIAMNRRRFEDRIIAEMMPRLSEAGESPFWECYGRRVTGLSFREADKLSIRDKEFIDALFPSSPLYVCMLPPEVQASIGTVRPETEAAVRLLEGIGLRFLNQVDPFDAGPYYGGPVAEVSLVKALRRCRILPSEEEPVGGARRDFLLGWESAEAGFSCARVSGTLRGRGLHLSRDTLAALGLAEGARGALVPWP